MDQKQVNQSYFKLAGSFTVEHVRNGKVIDRRVVDNLITNAGKAQVAGLVLSDVGGTAFDYIAIGTDNTAAAAANTALGAEITTGGGARAASTGTRVTTSVTNDTAQLVATWTFSGSFAIVETGVLNASSAGVLLARQVFSTINVQSGDQLTITWKIQIS